jgi:hypothetical protein
MKKAWIIIGAIFAILVIIQFFQPEKNDKVANPQNDIVFSLEIPTPVKKKLVNACYDCHSEKTVYPFYNRVAPVNWILARHIREGKEHLNFSAWATYDKKKQIKLLNEVCEVITNGEMPLKGYVMMHGKAVINEKEIEEICAWTEQAAEQVMSRQE